MRPLLVIATVLLLASCAGIPYGPLKLDASEDEGYSEERLTEGLYLVRYDGRGDQTHEEIRHLLVRRASDLCPGSFTLSEYAHQSGMVIHSEKAIWPYVTARVQCNEPPIHRELGHP